MQIESGTVYWLTGLAGAGKTTLGQLLYQHLKQHHPHTLFLDGDILRSVFADQAYTLEDRRKIAFRNGRLCQMLSQQGLIVVCATISMFEDCRQWNREQIPGYLEIFIDVPLDVLIQRDQKQLYSRALRGEISQVMGIDLPPEYPQTPDIILTNDGTASPAHLLTTLLQKLSTKRPHEPI